MDNLLRTQRYGGITGVLVLWVGISLAMHRAGLGFIDSRPISYLGVYPETALLFSISLIISSVSFVNFAFHLQRSFAVSTRFMAYFLIGQAGQVIAAVAPYGTNSPYKKIHTIAAFVLAFSLPLLIREFAQSQSHSRYYQLYLWLQWLEVLTFIIGIGLFVFTTGIAPLGEALPAIGFHIWLLSLTVMQYRIAKM